ncbi:hypothetical protein QO010_001689 [Caulobacter ginsengisoli]|uniref:Chemotaxis protein n=1 Tax=Caulobacter ginsengisoli TaxID=400775 RepID=A0ABU0IRY7_9CAUL|nr:hypothetical protein [Caulobacter ginsengisoli]MDQ0463918.1 hypothetical protein [Caulobacter ginsengisoli]
MPQMPTEFDAQDSAEVFDETNLTKDGGDIANFDTLREVRDFTSASDDDDLDGDEGELDEADFDDDAVDGDVLEAGRDDDGLRRTLSAANDVDSDDDQPDDYQASSGDPGEGGDDTPPQEIPDDGDHTPEEQPMEADEHVDKQLDKGLKETFPASDPVSINPGAD